MHQSYLHNPIKKNIENRLSNVKLYVHSCWDCARFSFIILHFELEFLYMYYA
jgi:hypothetical protein